MSPLTFFEAVLSVKADPLFNVHTVHELKIKYIIEYRNCTTYFCFEFWDSIVLAGLESPEVLKGSHNTAKYESITFLYLHPKDALQIQRCNFWEALCIKMHDLNCVNVTLELRRFRESCNACSFIALFCS